MQVDDIMFMLITMVSVLQECTFLGVIQEGKMIAHNGVDRLASVM
jgi:hypothetical protein